MTKGKKKNFGIHLGMIETNYIEVKAKDKGEAQKIAKERFDDTKYYITFIEEIE